MEYLAPRIVETERLVLRPFAVGDHAEYARITADPDVMRYMGTGVVLPPELAWRGMAGMLGHWELLGYGIWAVTTRDGRLLGQAGFIDVPGWPAFELAWMLGREHWGKGYAYEAAGAALRIARDTLKKERIISLIRPANVRSIALAKRLGAQREGEAELMGAPAEVYVHRAQEYRA